MTNFVISTICAAVGFVAAWLTWGRRLKTVQRELEVARQESAEKRPEVRDLLQQILQVATRLDDDVGRHSHFLTEVSSGIKQALGDQPSAVVDMAQKLLKSSVQLRGELQTARQQIASKQQELATYVSEARTDTLTCLKNRRSFNEELNRQFAQRQRQGTVFSLLLIDVDHFKKVNDVYGHLAGDLVLRSVAQVLSTALRDMDVVCRYGGEEFAVICPGSKLHEAAAAAERVRVAITCNSVAFKDGPVQVTASLGAAEVINGEIAEGLIQRADEALYSAKHAGRNRVHLHDGQSCVPADQTPAAAEASP